MKDPEYKVVQKYLAYKFWKKLDQENHSCLLPFSK